MAVGLAAPASRVATRSGDPVKLILRLPVFCSSIAGFFPLEGIVVVPVAAVIFAGK
jgi:hypothetical protein